jgi:ankyrin repeat protein
MMRSHLKLVAYLAVTIGFSVSNAGPREDFFHAVEVDASNVVANLLEQGFDPNTRDARGQNGLFLALRGESRQVAETLMKHPRLDVDAANELGETPLMMAALRGDLDLAQRLLERGSKVNRDGWTPLHYAASGPQPGVVSLLLDRGALVDALSPNGTTPLMMAARYGAIDSADLLLRRGADRTLKNQRGMNAAEFATSAGRETLAARLMPR